MPAVYRYFVSYTCTVADGRPGNGSIEITMDVPLSGAERVRAVEKYISDSYDLRNVHVNNFTRFDED